MKATYCKCKNTYTINKCNKDVCPSFYYWKQGMGSDKSNTVSDINQIDTTRTNTHTSS